MKIRLHFKTPDVVDTAIEQVMSECEEGAKSDMSGFDLMAKIDVACNKFVKYGELVTIEIDTKTKTAIVIPCT